MRQALCMLLALAASLAALPLGTAANSQMLPPCCGEAPGRGSHENVTVEMRRLTGETVTFRLLHNGDALLRMPELTAGRIRGQRFVAVYDRGRWITAPPEVWQAAMKGLRGVKGLERAVKSATAVPMTRTGETRVVAGVRGDVYRVGSLRGGTTLAVFTRDPAFEGAAQAYYDIFDVAPLSGSAAYAAAAARNAGFPLQVENVVVSRIRWDKDPSATFQFPSSFVGERELRRLLKGG